MYVSVREALVSDYFIGTEVDYRVEHAGQHQRWVIMQPSTAAVKVIISIVWEAEKQQQR